MNILNPNLAERTIELILRNTLRRARRDERQFRAYLGLVWGIEDQAKPVWTPENMAHVLRESLDSSMKTVRDMEKLKGDGFRYYPGD